MSKKSQKFNRKVLRNIFGIFSFTTALFIFQACYGTPQDFGHDFMIEGTVHSATSGDPIQGIQITVNDAFMIYTDSMGRFEVYTMQRDSIILSLRDINTSDNLTFQPKDTLLLPVPDSDNISLNILMNEIQSPSR